MDKEHGVGGRPAIGDPQHLRSDPGHPGEQHVRQKGKVKEADAFPAPGGDDPQPEEVRRAAEKQCGEEVREDLERVGHREGVLLPRNDENSHNPRRHQEAGEGGDHGAVRPGPQRRFLAARQLALGHYLGSSPANGMPQLAGPHRPKRGAEPAVPGP